MKWFLLFFLVVFISQQASAQKKKIDSLHLVLKKAKTDIQKYKTMHDLAVVYYTSRTDSEIMLSQQAYLIAEKHKWVTAEGNCLNNMGAGYNLIGDYTTAIEDYLRALKIYEGIGDLALQSTTNGNLGTIYEDENEYSEAISYYRLSLKQLQAYARSHTLTEVQKTHLINSFANITNVYVTQRRIDSAGKYLEMGASFCKKNNINPVSTGLYEALGDVTSLKGENKQAIAVYREGAAYSANHQDDLSLCYYYDGIAKCLHKMKQQDSAEFYAKLSLKIAQSFNDKDDIISDAKDLYGYYDEDHNTAEAYKYFKLATITRDSVFGQNKTKQVLAIGFNEKLRQRELADAEVQYQDKVRFYVLIASLGVLLLIAAIFWRNSSQRKKANRLLVKQKQQIETQRDLTNKAMEELQQTQVQLIQREKMASLGELTAGIAHEIQNPLNFVNNFSEVSVELLDEMDEELNKGDIQEAKTIGADLKQNLEKIKHHGKRADFIVKGMLEHSRTNTGEKQPTDMNVLCDEFLKLSFHGLRAKDKSFNAEMITHFDANLPKVNVSQQDMGRVMLNLFNNAFYAVNQKKKVAGDDYKPEVTVTTLAENGNLLIKVKDNGVGIPDAIKEKIMQPFFTTKPTGEGTGLGLSLTYDMLVNGHGGIIKVNSVEGEGSEFVISLPVG